MGEVLSEAHLQHSSGAPRSESKIFACWWQANRCKKQSVRIRPCPPAAPRHRRTFSLFPLEQAVAHKKQLTERCSGWNAGRAYMETLASRDRTRGAGSIPAVFISLPMEDLLWFMGLGARWFPLYTGRERAAAVAKHTTVGGDCA